MSNQEKFDIKQKIIAENEKKYGREIREKYGDEVVDKSFEQIKAISPEQYYEITKLTAALLGALYTAMKTGDPASELAQKAADLHRQWLSYFWDEYTKEDHVGVAQMYVEDERLRAFYDAEHKGAAEFLRDAVLIYTGLKK